MRPSQKLGFVAAKGIPAGEAHINAFALGAQSVDPKIEVLVIFTNDWSTPSKAEAANNLINQGVDVLTCHVDSPRSSAKPPRARHQGVRLPRQPGDARSQGLSDRRRVELGKGLHRLRQDAARRQDGAEPRARRTEGGLSRCPPTDLVGTGPQGRGCGKAA